MAKKSPDHQVPRFPATVLGWLTPPVLWAAYFAFIYSTHGIGCAGSLQGQWAGLERMVVIIAAATVLCVLIDTLVGAWAYARWRRIKRELNDTEDATPSGQGNFLAAGAVLNATLFGVATLWIGLPVLILQPCQ